VVWGPGRSQPCQVSPKSVQGFWLPEGSKSAIFLYLSLWLIQQIRATAQHVIKEMRRKYRSGSLKLTVAAKWNTTDTSSSRRLLMTSSIPRSFDLRMSPSTTTSLLSRSPCCDLTVMNSYTQTHTASHRQTDRQKHTDTNRRTKWVACAVQSSYLKVSDRGSIYSTFLLLFLTVVVQCDDIITVLSLFICHNYTSINTNFPEIPW